jgi:hypothetical protein
MDANLESKERYLFIRNDSVSQIFEKYFRANFIDVVWKDPNRQLRVFKYEAKERAFDKNKIHIMPFQWIKNAVKLEDIIGDTILPLDIVRVIDSFW